MLIVDDHAILRAGLKNLLLSERSVGTVVEAGDFGEAVAAVRAEDFCAVLLDINLPGRSGLDVLSHIRRIRPQLPVLMLSMHPATQYGLRAIRAGASGYLSKDCPPEELLAAVRTVLQGRRYITPEIAEQLAWAVSDPHDGLDRHRNLSNRELEILQLFGRGLSTAEIAELLCLSKNTVNTYRARILDKLDLRNSVELMRYAIEHQLA
ncbi:MAG: response regulator [Halothiobacillaceae bacterium]